jgi:hypothetical protein
MKNEPKCIAETLKRKRRMKPEKIAAKEHKARKIKIGPGFAVISGFKFQPSLPIRPNPGKSE